MSTRSKVTITFFILVLVLVSIGLFWDKLNLNSQSNLILNLTTSFAPEDHEPSPFGKYFRPGDIVKKTNLGYEMVLGANWLKKYHGGDAHYMRMEPLPEKINSDGTVNMHVNTCSTTQFIAKVNASLSKELSGDTGGIRAKEGCLTVVFGTSVLINDGGHPPEHQDYGHVSARSLLSELKSKEYYEGIKEKLASRSNITDKLYIVDEAFVMFGGKYVIKFSGDLDSNIKLSINDFFDGLLELESKIDYIYDNRNLVIEIDPFVRKNFMTLSWKLVPFEI
jgi:hypothetical protein